ncbi:MAG TPA: zinc ribbon domain-containing protein, partial [Acidimicrobiales bacterium]|nr:zinc ribbon domain-containing protein [Acidimicrobiales bacterium]
MSVRPGSLHPFRQYLLSGGLLRCGVCGSRLVGVNCQKYPKPASSSPYTRTYKCIGDRRQYHISINADFVEQIIISATLRRIEERGKICPKLITPPPDASENLTEAYERHAAALQTLASDYYVQRTLTKEEWQAARDGLKRNLRVAQRLYEPRWRPELARHPRGQANLRKSWDALDLSHRRDIIASELEFATIQT